MSTQLPAIHIVYASTSGNVEAVMEKVAATLQEYHYPVTLHRAEQTKVDVFNLTDIFILATSTWEHGEINPFWNRLLKEMEAVDLSGKNAGFVGLGDKRYEPVLFCNGMEILRHEFITRGGGEIFEPLKINGEPYNLLDTVVKEWAYNFIYKLKEFYAGK